MRRPDWPEILAAHIASRLAMPHRWGAKANDCVSGPAALGVAMGHADILAGLHGYRTARGASRKLTEAGYLNLEEMVSDRMDEVSLGLARRADLALSEHKGKRGIYRFTLAIIAPDGSLFGPGEHAGMWWPRDMAQRAFRFR